MIVRRLALFFALVFGLAMTQLPEFIQQYRQALGGAVGELSAIVVDFDSDSQQLGLTEQGGIDRLRANADVLARQRGERMADTVARLQRLTETQKQMGSEGPVGRIATFATHYDSAIARRAYQGFQPAVPVSLDAFVLGLIGFVFGGSLIHLFGRPFRRRRGHGAAEGGLA